MQHIEQYQIPALPTDEQFRPNVAYVPLVEATSRYKNLGRSATQVLLHNEQLGAQLEALESESLTDIKTGLANEKALDLSLSRILEREANTDRQDGEETNTAVLEIDVDGFKEVNDNLGHAAGDKILKLIGGALQGGVRETDMPAHIGGNNNDPATTPQTGRTHGDEYRILIGDVESGAIADMPKEERMKAMTERIHKAVVAAIGSSEYNGKLFELGVGVSIGWAFLRHGESAEEFIKRADAAMYEDKRARKASR